MKGLIEDRYEFSKKFYTVNSVVNPAAIAPQIVRDKSTSSTLAGNVEAFLLELLSPHQRLFFFILFLFISYLYLFFILFFYLYFLFICFLFYYFVDNFYYILFYFNEIIK